MLAFTLKKEAEVLMDRTITQLVDSHLNTLVFYFDVILLQMCECIVLIGLKLYRFYVQ